MPLRVSNPIPALFGWGNCSGCPLWAHLLMAVGLDIESPASSSPMDFLSSQMLCLYQGIRQISLWYISRVNLFLSLWAWRFHNSLYPRSLILLFSRHPLPFLAVNCLISFVYFANLGIFVVVVAASICYRIRLRTPLPIWLPFCL